MRLFALTLAVLSFLGTHAFAQEEDNDRVLKTIRKHGLEEPQVMEIARMITDVYGPRLTGSPMLDSATNWASMYLKEIGLQNVHLEEWGPFGQGWELEHFEAHANAKGYFPLIAYPKAWSPSATGSGTAIYLQASEIEDLEAYRGKLAGKVVLLDTIREVKEPFEPLANRHDSESLLNLANRPIPTPRPRRNWRGLGGMTFNRALWEMLGEEKPLVVVDRAYKGDLGTVFVSGARSSGEARARDKGATVVPQMTLSVEHYNRILRLVQNGIPVKVSLDLKTLYTNPDGMEHNIIAEIPGSEKADEVVMFGAHFDSWHSATGATDNGAGSSVMMEVARILNKTIEETGIRPKRTLRLALWTGEEQGLYGSINYVRDHFAETEPGGYTPKKLKPEQKKVSGYYNLDNGTGRIRGIYLQGNDKVAPIFREWFQNFGDLDATTLSLSNTGGTDHLAFDGVGIPGFQFIQEPMAYFSRTHHSNMDNWDHLVAEDLEQAATIIASLVWLTSQREELLPRKLLDIELEEKAKRENGDDD